MSTVDTDFSDVDSILLPLNAGNAERWNWTTGSTQTLNFVAGTSQDVELAILATGSGFLAYYISPYSVHQMVEATVRIAGSSGNQSWGVFARYLDASNYIRLYYRFSAEDFRLDEVSGGVSTNLWNKTILGSENLSSNGYGLKLEVVGRQARVWVGSFNGKVEDRPPDAVVQLANDPVVAGEWGIYESANVSSSTIRITHFYSRDLVNASMSAPCLVLENRQVEDLTPVELTADDVDAGSRFLQWQVSPFDPDDYAEVLDFTTLASVDSYVVYVRPGYDYEFRVRVIDDHGTPGEWASCRFTPAGSKTSPSSPTFPDDEFPPVDPDYVLVREQLAFESKMDAVTNREKHEIDQRRPRNRFTLKFENRTLEDIQAVMDFFDSMQGRLGAFIWVHPISGKQYAMRFDEDEISADVIDVKGEDDLGLHSLEVPITEVVYDVVGSITADFHIDPELTTVE
jgi:hypothetical protein